MDAILARMDNITGSKAERPACRKLLGYPQLAGFQSQGLWKALSRARLFVNLVTTADPAPARKSPFMHLLQWSPQYMYPVMASVVHSPHV
mmetsp:Transcript_21421/g.56483  ORF Transcript_21421/g.56483 Transcript_21421/m.56483 type:complete len:90 (+) Transcript_21421:221-490(+)